MSNYSAQRFTIRIALALSLFLTSIAVASAGAGQEPRQAPSSHQAVSLPPNIASSVPNGLSVSPFAIAEVDPLPRTDLPDHSLLLTLERIPLTWNEHADGRHPEQSSLLPMGLHADDMASGTHLLFIETGELTIITSEGEQLYRAGDSVVFPEGTPYSLFNHATECASILRFSATVTFVGGATVGAEEPTGALPVCGEPSLLVSARDEPIAQSTQLVLLRTIASGEVHFNGAHPGPVGYWMESGSADMHLPRMGNPEMNLELAAHSSISLTRYHGYSFGLSDTEALMIAALPSDRPLWMPAPLVHTTQFTLLFNESWHETGRASGQPGDSLSVRLTNGTTELFLENFLGYDGDPRACLDDAVAQLMTDPAVSNVAPFTENAPNLPAAADRGTLAGQYTFTRTDPDGTTRDLAKYIQCSPLPLGNSVLLISAFLPASDLDAQMLALDELLQGLIL